MLTKATRKAIGHPFPHPIVKVVRPRPTPSFMRYCFRRYNSLLRSFPVYSDHKKGVKYLIRLINAAADTTFVFSIDNHKFWVISTDFVAIEPYLTDHVVVGIGKPEDALARLFVG